MRECTVRERGSIEEEHDSGWKVEEDKLEPVEEKMMCGEGMRKARGRIDDGTKDYSRD